MIKNINDTENTEQAETNIVTKEELKLEIIVKYKKQVKYILYIILTCFYFAYKKNN